MADLLHAPDTAKLDRKPAAPSAAHARAGDPQCPGQGWRRCRAERIHQSVADAFAAADVDATIELVGGAELSPAVQTALGSRASGDRFAFDALVVGGGDGTISTAAGHLAETGIPLGVLPLGTLNHFAKDLGIPSVIDLAALVIAQGARATSTSARSTAASSSTTRRSASIPTWSRRARSGGARSASANGGPWCSRSCGCCAAFRCIGCTFRTGKRVAAAAARRARSSATTPTRSSATAFGTREALDRGELCLYIAKTGSRLSLLWLMAKAVFGRLKPARGFRADPHRGRSRSIRGRRACASRPTASWRRCKPPLRYRIRPRALRVLVPPAARL